MHRREDAGLCRLPSAARLTRHPRPLLQILVMSFPDKYHVLTLREVLDTCMLLQPGVELDRILCALIGRMTEHAGHSPVPQPIADRSAFHMFLAAARESGIRCVTLTPPPSPSPTRTGPRRGRAPQQHSKRTWKCTERSWAHTPL